MKELTDYRAMVILKTAPNKELIKTQFNLVHCGLGLTTEWLEYIYGEGRKNAIEELGDLLWYLVLTAENLEVTDFMLTSVNPPTIPPNYDENDFGKMLENFVSQIKKEVIYGMHQPLVNRFMELWYEYLLLIHINNCSLDTLMELNTAKLEKRYEEAFTSLESEIRKDKEDE